MTDQSILQDNDRPMDINLDSFYADILDKKFSSSVEAIDYCRKQCAHFGFTIKQEQSTYRNIYVYCSREGFPDSLRNPKSNPKRRRPSKRCDCRWRVVLNENNGTWEFRKSLNPEASKHNHELMRPEEIDKGWPKEMLDLICELTRQRLPTPDIRARVQLLFADIPWNERRFYNRLSEERQKQRVRDAEARVQQLHGLWSNVVAAAAGSQELTEIAQADIHRMVDKLCSMAQTDASTLPLPLVQQPSSSDHDHLEDLYDVGGQASSQDAMDTTGDSSSQDESTSKPTTSSSRKHGNKSANADTPKGFTAVTIPQQVLYVKLHAHRVLQDVQQLHRRRSRSLAFSDDFTDFGDDSSISSISQQKKQKTPMLKEMAQQQQPQQQQQQQPQPHPHLLSTTLQAQQLDSHHQYYYPQPIKAEQPPLPPSSGFMYPSQQREGGYYTSTLYPMYHQSPMPSSSRYIPPHRQQYHQQQQQQNNSIQPDNSNNNNTSNDNLSVYTSGRPPLLTVTPDFQQQQQSNTLHSSLPMTPPSSTSSSSSSPARLPHNQQPNVPMLSTPAKDSSHYMTDQHRLQLSQQQQQQQQQQQCYQQPQQQQQQRVYYSHLPNHLLPTDPQPQGIYYMDAPSSSSSSATAPPSRLPP